MTPSLVRCSALTIFFVYMTALFFLSYAHAEKDLALNDRCPVELEKRTMSRTSDFIIVLGKDLTHNLHENFAKMSLLALINGRVQAVPFQIDEINKDGKRVLPEHPDMNKRSVEAVKQDEDNGLLDENDELVFMIWDAGARMDVEQGLPSGVEKVDEIQMIDELDGGRAWVYLCFFSSEPPRSDKDYATYDTVREHVSNKYFDSGFSRKVPLSYDYMSFMGSPNLFDSYKMRFSIKIFGLKKDIDETQFDARLYAYKDGPVRVIRMVRSQVYMNRWMKSPEGYSTTIYYANSTVMPYHLKIPVSFSAFKRVLKIKMRAGCDFRGLRGWKAKSEADPKWFNVDGKMDEVEKTSNMENATWAILSGEEYGMIMRMVWDRNPDGTRQKPLFKSDFCYVDDDQALDPPEFVPGQSPFIGFWMRGLEKLKKGDYFFYVLIHIIEKPWQENIEKEYLDIMDHPLKTIVN